MSGHQVPTVPFGNTRISRLISGGNPLCGNSHFSIQKDREMLAYFTDEQVVQYLLHLESCGYNTLQARGDYHRILHWLELARRQGCRLQWIAQTASEMSDPLQNIRIIAAAGAIGMYVHGSRTDNYWLDGRIDELQDYLKCIRDCGLQAGLGTHNPEVVAYAEEKGWELDFYMTCFYNLSRSYRQSSIVANTIGKEGADPYAAEQFLPEDPPAMCRMIQATSKTCLAFKVLAAGRNCGSQEAVKDALSFAYANIKPQDAVIVGMFPRDIDQIRLNMQYVSEICAADAAV